MIDAEDAEQEAAVATEIEQMLSDLKRRVGRDPNPAEQEDESVTGNVTLCTKLTYQQDVVVEDVSQFFYRFTRSAVFFKFLTKNIFSKFFDEIKKSVAKNFASESR